MPENRFIRAYHYFLHPMKNPHLCARRVVAVCLFSMVVCAAMSLRSFAAELPRERLSLDANWKFHLGDDWPDALRLDKAGVSSGPAAREFADTDWRALQLPHDWAVELPFDPAADRNHGYKMIDAISTCPQPTPTNAFG